MKNLLPPHKNCTFAGDYGYYCNSYFVFLPAFCRHADAVHHARHRHEGDARDAGTYHAESHQIPRGTFVATIESLVRGLSARPPADGKQQGKI